MDFETYQPLPDHLISEDVSLDRLYMETSVIASTLSEEDLKNTSTTREYNASDTVDIPIT